MLAPLRSAHKTLRPFIRPWKLAPGPRHRYRALTWNAGGPSNAKLDEVFVWLHLEEAQGRPVHLMAIQETHWTFTSEWQAHGYWLIHSSLGTKTRSAGILHLIHQRFANTHQIRTDHAVPGRLLYTRLATEPPSPSSASTNTAGPRTPAQLPLWIIEAREGVWTKLHHLLHNLPSRHQLLVLGDFNTQCVPPPRIDKATPLQKDYVPMLPKHPSRPLSSSRLDLRTSGQRSHLPGRHRAFILCREHQSDRCTRQAHVLKRAPFVPTAGNTDSNHAVARSPPAPLAGARTALTGRRPLSAKLWLRTQTCCHAS